MQHSRDKGTGALVTFNRKKPKPSPLKGLLRQAVICRSGFSRDDLASFCSGRRTVDAPARHERFGAIP